MSSRLSSTFEGVRIDADGDLLCKCGTQAKDRRVQNRKSPYHGRQYWSCRKHSKDPSRCRTWIWGDEMAQVKRLIPPAMIAPRTPQKQRDIRMYGQLTPPVSRKRQADDSFDSAVGGRSDTEPGSPSPSGPSRKRSKDEDTATRKPAHPVVTAANRNRARGRGLFADLLGSPMRNRADATPTPVALRQVDHRGATGLLTPITSHREPSQKHPQLDQREPEYPTTPTKSNRISRLKPSVFDSHDSDQESYGWDDDLDSAIVRIASSAED